MYTHKGGMGSSGGDMEGLLPLMMMSSGKVTPLYQHSEAPTFFVAPLILIYLYPYMNSICKTQGWYRGTPASDDDE
jgi:hypothetical protein